MGQILTMVGRKDVVELLLGNGSQVNVEDRWGSKPLADAIHYKNNDVVKLLESHGARLPNEILGRVVIAFVSNYWFFEWQKDWVFNGEGPLGVSSQASEREFLACLRNGLILCNVMNKVQPGSVPKVVDNHLPSQSVIWDSQPLPAYQYFENIRNFLVAVQNLRLPTFEKTVESLKKALANREASSQIVKPKEEGMMTPSDKPKAIPQTPCLT
ncbi:hypothetical protein DM860_011784 [Cuscuta australis]|uniref:Calponin-homology (CH) domain-containing protein n=1 Tax=Cuscuta australis TaxID=267555 RepID=A0A328DFJ6_9ASTE|nr:hypothetical protein DM860_011784 [Cuscuta australis]